MADPGFVGPSYVAAALTQDYQETINWYPETDPLMEGQRGVVSLLPTPGLKPYLQMPLVKEVRALYTLSNDFDMVVVVGNTVYIVNSVGTIITIGTIPSQTGFVGVTDNGVSVYLTDGATRYSFNIGSTTITPRVDGGFTGGEVCDIVDSFIVYNRPGTNQWGCTNALSAISGGTNFGSKVGAPDPIVSIIVDHREVFLLGETTSEAWVNVGTFPFPFAVIPGTSTQHGCAARNSVARLGESFAYLSKDRRGSCNIYHMKGYLPVSISNYATQQAMDQYDVIDDAIAYTYQQNGHEFYVLTFPTADATWVYDLTSEMWHKRASRDNLGVLHRHRSNCGTFFQRKVIVGDYQNGMLYELSSSTYSDNGTLIPRIRRCRHLREDLNRLFHHKLQVQFQPGQGIVSGQGVNPLASLRWSDDGGFTWSNYHTQSIGRMGEYKNRTIWRQLGEARDRIYEVSISDPVYGAIISADLDASAGAH